MSPKSEAGRRIALNRLYREYAHDQRLAHMLPPVRGVVRGDGPMRPALMFVGEAPGRSEDKAGKPFVGASGKLLMEMLASVGCTREDVYITNCVKIRPVSEGGQNRPPTDEEIKASIPYLRREHVILGSPPMVVLGRHARSAAARLHTRADTLLDPESGLRLGEWSMALGHPVLPLYHPAYGIYQKANKPMMFEMFKAVLRVPRGGVPR